MKIAITGHSAGIGQALAKIFEAQGHEIIGLSRRNGYNIRSLPKVASMIESCDMFVNNAQVGYAQTELLFEVWRRWQGQQKRKRRGMRGEALGFLENTATNISLWRRMGEEFMCCVTRHSTWAYDIIITRHIKQTRGKRK